MNRSTISEFSSSKKVDLVEVVSPTKPSNSNFKAYSKKYSSHRSNKSLGAEEIRALLRKEQAKEKTKWQNNKESRDVSYLKDRLKPANFPLLPPLPTDIDHLKKLLESSTNDLYYISPKTRAVCKRENCVDFTLEKIHSLKKTRSNRTLSFGSIENSPVSSPTAHDSIEIGFAGIPSGRQEIDHLRKWFSFMVGKYSNTDDIQALEAIYVLCGRELVRQVTVHCAERGELLRDLFARFDEFSKIKEAKINEKITELNKKAKNELQQVKKLHGEVIEEYKGKIEELNKKIKKKKESKTKLKEDIIVLRVKLKDAARMHEQEQTYSKVLREYAMTPNREVRDKKGSRLEKVISTVMWKKKIDRIDKTVPPDSSFLLPPDSPFVNNSDQSVESNPEPSHSGTDSNPEPNRMDSNPEWSHSEELKNRDETFVTKSSKSVLEKGTQTDMVEINHIVNHANENINEEYMQKMQESSSIAIIRENFIENDYEKNKIESTKEELKTNSTNYQNEDKPEIKANLKLNINNSVTKEINAEQMDAADKNVNITKSRYFGSSHNKISNPNFSSTGFLSDYSNSKNAYDETNTKLIKEMVELGSPVNKDSQLMDEDLSDIEAPHNLYSATNGEISIILTEAIGSSEAKKIDRKPPEELTQNDSFLSPLNLKDSSDKHSSLKENNRKKSKTIPNSEVREEPSNFAEFQILIDSSSQELKSVKEEIKKHMDMLNDIKKQIQSKQKMLNKLIYQKNTNEDSPGVFMRNKSLKDRTSLEAGQINLNDNHSIAKLIPADANVDSWKEGFQAGLEKGKSMGFAEGEDFGIEEGKMEGYIQAIYEKDAMKTVDLNDEDSSDESVHEESKIDLSDYTATFARDSFEADSPRIFKKTSRKLTHVPYKKDTLPPKKKGTEIMEFNFHKAEIVAQKKINPANSLLETILKKKTSRIKKYSTMGLKMINRMISTIYQNGIQLLKEETEESLSSLADLTYDEIFQRYGVKVAAEKKFRDFIASLFNTSTHKRSLMYIKFLNCGNKIGATNYTRQSLVMYLKCLDFMLASNIGIMSGYLDTSEINMFPTLRAIECAKDKFDPKHSISAMIIQQIETKSIIDPKRINPYGLIELEDFLEIVVETYETYQRKTLEGVQSSFEAVDYKYDQETPNVWKQNEDALI
ncbi:unnamed protein product [Blepharisma stoltei]|uniref:FH2 domain-containing protein n=1 Tax=Blepharisma stoltei TaxID=1481888 RepID=A0AAU9JBY5_9CILI|nr:unnamed protein product [Blepharisma stoltei]